MRIEADETEIAWAIAEFCESTLGETSDADNDGYTAFYLERDGKRFKIMVRECGEDV